MEFCTARAVDRWVGIPACFFLSVYDSLKVFFPRRKNTGGADPEKILFIGLSEIGSNVLAYGAIKKAQEMFPRARLYFLTFEENKEVLEILGAVSARDIFTVRSRNFGVLFRDTLRFFRLVRRERIGAVVDLELFSRFSAILAYLSGAGVRVGFHGYTVRGLYRGGLLTHRVQFNQQRHIAGNFMALVKALKADPSEKPLLKESFSEDSLILPRSEVDSAAVAGIWEKLRRERPKISAGDKIVVLNPEIHTRLPLRSWPASHYLELAAKFMALPDVWVVVIGTGEKDPAFDIKNDRCINLTGKTSLQELVALFHVARVLVSHDSGAVHLASLTEIEKVVLFGPETPLLYRPLGGRCRIVSQGLFCSPCLSSFNYRNSACRDNRCMKNITVGEVFEITQEILDRTASGEK